jgi:Domain of unknown function (DU1801)
MAANKTAQTGADVDAFVATVADPIQRADCGVLIEMMSKASGHPPRMWGPSIIGFGSYHYKYDSGREGDSLRIGFSPRKGQTVLYLIDGHRDRSADLARLGKHKTGKSCLYIKRLADIDQNVLKEIISASLAYMESRYPAA